jgi:hypothetical protein
MKQDVMPLLHDRLQRQAGIVAVATLVEAGCTPRQLHRLVESGEFELILPGVLRSRHWPVGAEQWMMAVCLRNKRAVIAFLTAAKHWRFRGIPPHDGVHVLVPHSSSPAMREVVVHRCRDLAPADIVTLDDGRRFTSPPRTLFDCADLLGTDGTASVLEQLINDGMGLFTTHLSMMTRLAHSRRPGTRTMVAVISSRPAWRGAMQSGLETRVMREIERQGLPQPEVQYSFRLPSGAIVRFDFAWPSHTATLEVDHPFWHAGAIESHRDKHRDLQMTSIGWLPMRITNLDVEGGLSAAIATVGKALALR